MERTCKALFTSARSVIRGCLLLAGIAALTGMAACSKPAQLMLFNNTGAPIKVYLAPRYAWSRKDITIGSGMSARFDYPVTNQGWRLRLSASGCEATYSVPHYLNIPHYLSEDPLPRDSYDIPVHVQIEPDLAIYLVPPLTKAVVDVGRSASLQVQGLPLRPSSRSCLAPEPKT